jgi:hypothetical protein
VAKLKANGTEFARFIVDSDQDGIRRVWIVMTKQVKKGTRIAVLHKSGVHFRIRVCHEKSGATDRFVWTRLRHVQDPVTIPGDFKHDKAVRIIEEMLESLKATIKDGSQITLQKGLGWLALEAQTEW